MLRLVRRGEVRKVEILGTMFHLKTMSLVEKEDWLERHRNIMIEESNSKVGFDKYRKSLSEVILKIEGHEDMSPYDVLGELEHYDDYFDISREVIKYCSITPKEAKNSDSSSEPSTSLELEETVEKNVKIKEEPASTTPTQES